MFELKFSNKNEALQYLANITKRKILVADKKEKIKPLKIPNNLRSRINNALNKAGLDGNKGFSQISQIISTISSILNKFDMEFNEMTNSDLLSGNNGQRLITIAQSNPEDQFSPTPIENSSMFLQWSPLGDTDKISAVAYLT